MCVCTPHPDPYAPFSIFSGEKEAGALIPPSSSEEAAEEDEASPRRVPARGPSRARGARVEVAASPRRVRKRTRCMLVLCSAGWVCVT